MSKLLDTLKESYSGPLLTEEGEITSYLTDWRKQWKGRAIGVALPATTDEVSSIMRWAFKHNIKIVPQGGNTGLSGGAVPSEDGHSLILALTRMNKIRSVDIKNNTLIAEAGVILATVQNAAIEAQRLFPLSLGAEGSCTIGGNLATNAGGTAVLRFGNMRDLCLGLEVVTSTGEIWNGLSALRKKNCGYDLRNLFIGSEGTLGIITAAVLKLFPTRSEHQTVLLATASLSSALDFFSILQNRFNDELTAFEIISAASFNLVCKQFPNIRAPLDTKCDWYVLSELSYSTEDEKKSESFEEILGDSFEKEMIIDAVIAASEGQRNEIWAIRENITEAQSHVGRTIKHDISIPISHIAPFYEQAQKTLSDKFPDCELIVFGHVGDGNLHFNVTPPPNLSQHNFDELQKKINTIVHDLVHYHQGAISAEHGLGILRRDEAVKYRCPVETALMQKIKLALDPKLILNPQKLIPLP